MGMFDVENGDGPSRPLMKSIITTEKKSYNSLQSAMWTQDTLYGRLWEFVSKLDYLRVILIVAMKEEKLQGALSPSIGEAKADLQTPQDWWNPRCQLVSAALVAEPVGLKLKMTLRLAENRLELKRELIIGTELCRSLEINVCKNSGETHTWEVIEENRGPLFVFVSTVAVMICLVSFSVRAAWIYAMPEWPRQVHHCQIFQLRVRAVVVFASRWLWQCTHTSSRQAAYVFCVSIRSELSSYWQTKEVVSGIRLVFSGTVALCR